ncbi:hypothetical protein KBY96_06105 [Cyanobium sp. ATX 6A2]|nr:hypothetical protein [Cyanobium sp. ATX 6A2]
MFSEPDGLLKIAIADLEGAWGFWLQQAVEIRRSPMTCADCCCCWRRASPRATEP